MNSSQFFSALLLCVLCLSANAQVLVGPVVGTQVGWFVFDDKDKKDFYKVEPVIGFHLGGSLSFRVKDRFFLQTSLLYSQKKKVIEGKQDQMLRNETTLRYLEMPILYTVEFKAKLGKDKVYKWYLGVGPSINYWLSSKGTLQNTELNENLVSELEYKVTFEKDPESVQGDEMNIEEPNRLQLGLNVSAGLIFEPFGTQKIMVTARYEFGHSFLAKTDGVFPGLVSYQDELQVRSQAVVFSAYYFLDLKTSDRKKGKSTSKLKRGRSKN